MTYNSTITNKPKKCKGTGKAKGFKGCGVLSSNRKYGLCVDSNHCYGKWVLTTEEGQQHLKSRVLPKAKKVVSESDKKLKKEAKKKQWKANKNTFYSSSAWKWFSRFVKLYHANQDGTVKCVTSGQLFNLNNPEDSKNIHAGHFIKVFDTNSTNYSTAFVLNNCYPQSASENNYNAGNQLAMEKHIVNVHGKEELQALRNLSKKPFKLDKWQMEEIADFWRKKYKQLVKEKGFDPF